MERGRSNGRRGPRRGGTGGRDSGRNSPSISGRGQYRGNSRNRGNYQNSNNNDGERQHRGNFNRSNNNEAGGGRRKFPMGFKVLQSMVEEVGDIEDVIFKLSNEREGFSLLLDSDLKDKPDSVVLITRILNRICDESGECHLLKKIFVDGKFLKTLKSYISTLEFQNHQEKRNNSCFWKDTDLFWTNLTNICRHLNEKYPSIGCEVTPELLDVLQIIIERVEQKHDIHVSDEIKATIASLLEVSNKLKSDMEVKKAIKETNTANSNYADYVEPTDDFREMNIYPTASEITNRERSFYLNANRIEGKYGSINEYLDVQFRLLREDFVGPLRKGICQHMDGSKEKNQEVKIHRRVQFLNAESVNEFYCYRTQFDFSKKKRSYKYENSKKFMFGSLLCFTKDNFNTVFFGRICKRDLTDLENGQIIVGFEKDLELIAFNIDYLMVECNVYFEPYFHVLGVLQRFSMDRFPMKKYIIDVEQDIDPPLYLLNIDPIFYEVENVKFWPLNWPDETFYGLNNSQSAAFKAALTSEFTVIQGPPGTGKTFVGLKIAHTLLNNQHAWYKRSPILVICYTNHALDQFLEGIASCTDRILRVGGQSKNENIAKFNINIRAKKSFSPAVHQARNQSRDYMHELKNVNNSLEEIDKRNCIIDFNMLRKVIPEYETTWFFNAQKKQILDWLLAGKETNREETPFAAGTQLLNINAENADNVDRNADEEDNVEFEENVEIIDDIFDGIQVGTLSYIVSLDEIRNNIKNLIEELDSTRRDCYMTEEEKLARTQDLFYEINTARSDLEYLNKKLEEGSTQKGHFNDAAFTTFFINPNRIAPDDRWRLYFFWLVKLREGLLVQKNHISENFRQTYEQYNSLRSLEDSQLMKNHLVVGMTTTGAARMHSALQTIKCPIVIVEEAAEVLEAHIISALTVDCKHLILIGDHQQLKPSTADYKIEKKFKLGVSLFERMVLNKIECHTLNVQHRMRPEISALIAPTIYPALQNHESVHNRPQIDGVEKTLYFIDHQEPEQLCSDASKKNLHEATFVISLAKHLILNGYKAEQITILAAYLGQMFEMQKMRRKYNNLLKDVRIAVLDNYQGEESDIILLSLVRSNEQNSIGFLKIENRVCVALSRARNGLYVIGNMNLLCAGSEIWPKIKTTLQQQDAIGPKLCLVCQVHQNRKTLVSCEEDFLKISEGGCDLKCGKLLGCGHICARLCHIMDRDHVNYNCLENCTKLLCDTNPNHKCRKHCYQECGPCTYKVPRMLNCGHQVSLACHIDPDDYKCLEPVITTLQCEHVVDKPCHEDAKTFRCTHMCDVRVEPCGHACAKRCHIFNDPDHIQYQCKNKCTKYRVGCTVQEESHRCPRRCFDDCMPCELPVSKKRSVCPHMFKVACNVDVDDIICEKPCSKMLECGHKCKGKCCEPCPPCKIMVEKAVLDCEHKVKVQCSQYPDRKLCRGKCPRKLPCGHICTRICNQPCTDNCRELVDCHLPGECGHIITKIKCHLKSTGLWDNRNIVKNCNAPCGAKLECGHVCLGSCGDCYQGRVHKKCAEKCGVPLICNHECPFPCREACKPCQKPCEYKCVHSKCGKKCGEPCTKCKQKCARRCKHQECKRWCGDICNVDACLKPCENRLPCGHDCAGLCGDPCPKLCKICDKDELTEIFFGDEGDEDARFVQLDECGHIFESGGLHTWFAQTNDEVVIKCCPKCKTPVTKTLRYSHYLKQMMKDVDEVKKKLNGKEKENEIKRVELEKRLQALNARSTRLINRVIKFATLMNKLADRLSTTVKNRRQRLSNVELNAILAKLQILEHLVDVYNNNEQTHLKTTEQINFITQILLKDNDRISNQEVHDIELEIFRLQRIIQFENIIHSDQYRYVVDKCTKLVVGIQTKIYNIKAYSEILNNSVSNDLKQLNQIVSSSAVITDTERREIVKAMGFSLGHWFKCPNGHIYAIGDCGGAMVESNCPECGATIGGTRHQLRSDNEVASEMDGARHSAWSEAANMGNYRFF